MLIPTDRTLVDNLIIRFSFSIGGSSTYFLALLDKRGDDLAEGRALDHRHVNDVDARGELSEFIMLMPLSTPRDNCIAIITYTADYGRVSKQRYWLPDRPLS
jgi:hypothetical protein